MLLRTFRHGGNYLLLVQFILIMTIKILIRKHFSIQLKHSSELNVLCDSENLDNLIIESQHLNLVLLLDFISLNLYFKLDCSKQVHFGYF